jgi:hypothetical protein
MGHRREIWGESVKMWGEWEQLEVRREKKIVRENRENESKMGN